jgi:hypothetical protein
VHDFLRDTPHQPLIPIHNDGKCVMMTATQMHHQFLTRVVVGVDPAVSSGDDSAEWGIVVVGMGPNPSGQEWPPHFYVMDDLSGKFSPKRGRKASRLRLSSTQSRPHRCRSQ